jgi:hypothetical protein
MQDFAAQQTLIVQLLQQLPNRVGNVVLNAAHPPPVPAQAPPPHHHHHHPIPPPAQPADSVGWA